MSANDAVQKGISEGMPSNGLNFIVNAYSYRSETARSYCWGGCHFLLGKLSYPSSTSQAPPTTSRPTAFIGRQS
jgi:hypothetical protein